MLQNQLVVLSCIEHERLEFALMEVRARAVPDPSSSLVARRAGGVGREQKALSSLVNYELEQGCRG